ncbi:MAG TPA: hypothetical protein VKZ57_01400 [Sphingobacterium sp.]|nr:hypothetical protein [Sphingobacterium sp.]
MILSTNNFMIAIALVCLFVLNSCKQGDDYYYNYQAQEKMHDGTIYNYIINQKGVYDSLAVLLERVPELKQKLDDPQLDLTFFVINNRSFALALENLNVARRQNNRQPLYLEDIPLNYLDSLAYRYTFDEAYNAVAFEGYVDGEELFSSKFEYPMNVKYIRGASSGLVDGGQQVLELSDRNRSNYTRYWNTTETALVDLYAKNGIIHTLVPRHEFGFGKLVNYLSNK